MKTDTCENGLETVTTRRLQFVDGLSSAPEVIGGAARYAGGSDRFAKTRKTYDRKFALDFEESLPFLKSPTLEILSMRECRTRLIADGVTGKRHVRSVAAKHPDLVDEASCPDRFDPDEDGDSFSNTEAED